MNWHRCPWCGREFEAPSPRGVPLVRLADHLIDCPVRSRDRELQRRLELERYNNR